MLEIISVQFFLAIIQLDHSDDPFWHPSPLACLGVVGVSQNATCLNVVFRFLATAEMSEGYVYYLHFIQYLHYVWFEGS